MSRTTGNTVRESAPSKLFARAYPVIVNFMRIECIQVTHPFYRHVAIYEIAAFSKDNVRVETTTKLTETHKKR